MTFRRAAQAALAGRKNPGLVVLAVALVLAGLSASCGSKSSGSSGASHNAYITLPQTGQVGLLHLNNSTGAISLGPLTPPVVGNSPSAVVLHPSGKFLYAINEAGDTISIFNVAGDGSLTLSATPTPAGSSPRAAAIDSTGNYLLVTNNLFDGTVSVFAVGSGGGTLSQVPNSPFSAGPYPTDLKITGTFVYVANPSIEKVEVFSLNTSNGFLTPSLNPPVTAGAGLNAIAIDPGGHYLYTANTSDKTFGTVSAFQIDATSGDLTEIYGSPYCSTPGCTGAGSGPGALAVDPSGKFLYVSTPGSTSSIWGFTINSANGQLVPLTNSPFSLSAGTLFLIMEPTGKFFYIGDQTGSNIAGYSYDPSTGVPTAISGSPFSTGTAPGGMLITH